MKCNYEIDKKNKQIGLFCSYIWYKFAICFILAPTFFQAQLNVVLDSWKNDKDLKGASFGYSVRNLKTDEIIAEHNSHELMIPASTLKIITTSAALNILGANFKYETKITYTGNYNKDTGILDGDLVIVGSGDPSLQSDNFSKENILSSWAKALKQAGIKQIKGNIVGDASVYEKNVPSEWVWGDISNYFGSPTCGLSFMDNKFKLLFNSSASGSEAKLINTSPNYVSKKYDISSRVIAQGNEDEAYVYGDPFSFTKDVKGTIPPNKQNYEVEASLPDPALLCAEMLLAALEKEGVLCPKKTALSNYKKETYQINKKPLYTHYSPSLDKLIYFANLKSNNQYCESFLRQLGKGSAKEGLDVIKLFCKERGMNTDELYMTDACGLSRANTVTPAFLALLLTKVSKDSIQFKLLKNSFPVAGKSGSMSNIGKGSYIVAT
jgi:serine-type D-Ala-D-Ala carboxypeptidase/endopeptidase (penicillin-binding protein 4)